MEVTTLRHIAFLRTARLLGERDGRCVLALSICDIVVGIDRCRGMHTLVITSPDGRAWCQLRATDFVAKVRTQLPSLGSSGALPLPSVLLATMANKRNAAVRLELPATIADLALDIPLPSVREWTVPHPYCFNSQLFWPSSVVEVLGAELFGSPELAALSADCGRQHAPEMIPALFDSPTMLASWFQRVPFLLLLFAALASQRVRQRWLDPAMVVGSSALWGYLLHTVLLRAVDMFWATDALAARGLAGVPGVRICPLGSSRLRYLQPRIEPAPSPLPVEPRNPIALDSAFPMRVRLDHAHLWFEIDSADLIRPVERNCTGLPAQLVVNSVTRQFFVVAECALDEFAAQTPEPDGLVMPIEMDRVCRRLAFVDQIPVGAEVLCPARTWPTVIGLVGELSLVDLAPGRYVASPEELDRTLIPANRWPFCAPPLHPRRSAPGSDCIKTEDGRWWRCSDPGPSVCLDPPLDEAGVRTVLGFQMRHAAVNTPTATALYACTPPALAAMPAPVPAWHRCRLGCRLCTLPNAMAYCGDAAILSRQELACLLWWHWQRFADHIFCLSDRAEELGTRWLQPECWRMKEYRAQGNAARLATRTPPLPGMPATNGNWHGRGNGHAITLRDGSQWEVNNTVFTAATTCTLDPLIAHAAFLASCINPGGTPTYKQWIDVGQALHRVDPNSDGLANVWHWWSRKYGGSAYNPESFVGNTRWHQLQSRSRIGEESADRGMARLAGMAKVASGGILAYQSEAVITAVREFSSQFK